jgi:lysozyme family protein
MSDRFSECHPITAGWEGGWSNHPDDPGGATMYGVTQAVYDAYRVSLKLPKQSVRKITMAEALEIYRKNYWLAAGCDTLFAGVDLATYDGSVNSGVSRGRKWLLAALGSADHSETVRRICKARLAFVKGLRTWTTFGNGWSRRITDIEAKGVVMALTAMEKSKAEIATIVTGHVETAEKDAKSASTQSKAAGAATAATPAVATTQVDVMTTFDWIVAGGATLAFVALVIWLINTRRENEARVASYKEALA